MTILINGGKFVETNDNSITYYDEWRLNKVTRYPYPEKENTVTIVNGDDSLLCKLRTLTYCEDKIILVVTIGITNMTMNFEW